MLDVNSLRKRFPALVLGAAHFDSPGGSHVADVVADAVSTTLRSAIANRGRVTRAERRADDIVVAARCAVADLLNVEAAQRAGAVVRWADFNPETGSLTVEMWPSCCQRAPAWSPSRPPRT